MSLRCRRMKQPAVSLTVTVWLNIKYSTYTVYINIYIHTYDHPHLLTQVLCLWFPVSRCSLLVRLYFLTSSSLHVKTSDGSGSLQTSLQVLILVSVHGLSWETSFHLCWRGFFFLTVLTQTCAGVAANDLENKQNKTYENEFWFIEALLLGFQGSTIQCTQSKEAYE